MDGAENSFLKAHDALRAWLANGRWRAGEKLNLVAVADELRLSATPVREAAWRLVGEDLIEFRRGQGYFVPSPLVSEIEDLYFLLEALALQAIARLDQRMLAATRGEASDMDRLADALLLASGNAIALRIAENARARLWPVERFAPAAPVAVARGTPMRAALKRAMRRHYAERRKAAAAMRAAREREDERLRQISRL